MFFDVISGKTESTKLLVQHIAELCKSEHTNMHQRIIEVRIQLVTPYVPSILSLFLPLPFTVSCLSGKPTPRSVRKCSDCRQQQLKSIRKIYRTPVWPDKRLTRRSVLSFILFCVKFSSVTFLATIEHNTWHSCLLFTNFLDLRFVGGKKQKLDPFKLTFSSFKDIIFFLIRNFLYNQQQHS